MAYLGVYGWRDDEELIEEFPSHCYRCRGDVPHGRIEITRKNTIFWMAFQEIGPRVTKIRCRRCGHESHVRDMTDLASPIMRAKYTFALRACAAALCASAPTDDVRRAAVRTVAVHYSIFTDTELVADRASKLDVQLDEAVRALHDEAGAPLAKQFVSQLLPIAAAAASDEALDIVRATAVALNISSVDFEHLVAD